MTNALTARYNNQIVGTRTGKADFKFAIIGYPNIELRGKRPFTEVTLQKFNQNEPVVLCWSKTEAAAQKAAETHIREKYWTGVEIVPAEKD